MIAHTYGNSVATPTTMPVRNSKVTNCPINKYRRGIANTHIRSMSVRALHAVCLLVFTFEVSWTIDESYLGSEFKAKARIQ